MKRLILSLILVLALSIVATAAANDDISGVYIDENGKITIKQSGDNQYNVELYLNPMDKVYTDFKGKGSIVDGILVVKNPYLKEIVWEGGNKELKEFVLNIYLGKHRDMYDKSILEQLPQLSGNQVAIIDDISFDAGEDGYHDHGEHAYARGPDGDAGFAGIFTKK
jgi:hypothetical protein